MNACKRGWVVDITITGVYVTPVRSVRAKAQRVSVAIRSGIGALHQNSNERSETDVLSNRDNIARMISGQTGGQDMMTQAEQTARARSRHDIRASLAITNGFNQALASSFLELCETYEQLLNMHEPQSSVDLELKHQAEKLEADCQFCMSRIKRSLEQLGQRIDKDILMSTHTRSPSPLDIR